MIISNIDKFKNGWFLGNFDPSLLKTKDFEVAVQRHPKGFVGNSHYHTKSTEYNLVVEGKMNISGKEVTPGDIFVFEPNEISVGKFLENTVLVVIRTPSVNDKVEIKSYGQWEFDRIIYNQFFPGKRDGVMIEAGGATPEYHSMSKMFKNIGWRAVIIEPVPRYYDMHIAVGNEVYRYALSSEDKKDGDFCLSYANDTISSTDHPWAAIKYNMEKMNAHRHVYDIDGVMKRMKIIKVDYITLNTLIEKVGNPHINFLCLDIEGGELDALKGFDINKYQPDVIMIEIDYPSKDIYNYITQNTNYKLWSTVPQNLETPGHYQDEIYVNPKLL